MITVDHAIKIHNTIIDKFGGTSGLRDKNLLESALARPYQTFDQKDLYKTPAEKSSALIESLITNHPFIDGNKRFDYIALRLLLLNYGFDVIATQDEKYEFVMTIAKGELKYPGIYSWINSHLTK